MKLTKVEHLSVGYQKLTFSTGGCVILQLTDGYSKEDVIRSLTRTVELIKQLPHKPLKTLTNPAWIGKALYGATADGIIKTSKVERVLRSDNGITVETLNALYAIEFKGDSSYEDAFSTHTPVLIEYQVRYATND